MTLVQEICTALLDRLVVVVEGLAGGKVALQKGSVPPETRQWVVEIAAEGAVEGICQVAIGHAGAEALTAVVTGIDGDVPPAAIVDALKEMVSQAISAHFVALADADVQLKAVDVTLLEGALPGTLVASGVISGGALTLPVSVQMQASLAASLSQRDDQGDAPAGATSASRIDVILDIDLPVTVRFGRTDMQIRALTKLGLGSVIDLGRSPDDPVEVLVGDRVVARGEVLIVGGNYGVRILDVVTPSERMRTMERQRGD